MGRFFSIPDFWSLVRTATLALLFASILLNFSSWQTVGELEAKLNEIYDTAEMQGGWVYFAFPK